MALLSILLETFLLLGFLGHGSNNYTPFVKAALYTDPAQLPKTEYDYIVIGGVLP